MSPSNQSQGSPWLILVMVLVFAGVGYGVWRAQSSGAAALEEQGGPYLDALVAGEWAKAATLDHSSRTVTAEALTAAWEERQGRLGDLTGWTLHVANPGADPDGAFVHSTVQLTFAGKDDTIPLRVELREEADGSMKVARAVPTSKFLLHETVW